jgi:hypothetical protein
MTLTQQDFESIIQNSSKYVQGDIKWLQDPHHELLVKFIVTIVL